MINLNPHRTREQLIVHKTSLNIINVGTVREGQDTPLDNSHQLHEFTAITKAIVLD